MESYRYGLSESMWKDLIMELITQGLTGSSQIFQCPVGLLALGTQFKIPEQCRLTFDLCDITSSFVNCTIER